MTYEILETIYREFFWIALLFSLGVGFFGPGNVAFEGQTPRHQKWYNKFVNFVSGATGWLAFYVFITVFLANNGNGLSSGHVLLLIIGVLGIVGFLPKTLVEIINSMRTIIENAAKKLS